jgi:hypothetical protein
MAELASTRLRMSDIAKRLNPDGSAASIAEVLENATPILGDAPMVEANGLNAHRSTRRAALPSVGWRRLNSGTIATKSVTDQVQDATALLEAWGEIDEKVASLNGNTAEWRMQEAVAFLQAMAQEFEATFFYGNAGTDDKEFDGVATRYNVAGAQVLDAGSADTDNTSIYLMGWGVNTAHLIYPKGSTAGIQHVDHGKQVIESVNGVAGAKMSGYVDQYTLEVGFHVKDPRFIVRIGSIELSALAGSTPADLTRLMTKAIWRIPNLASCSPVFYMNRSAGQYLDLQRQDRMDGNFTYEVIDGVWTPKFRQIPIHIADEITDSETAV